MRETKVIISKNAQKDLKSLPKIIIDLLMIWITALEEEGLTEVRKVSGYHDEPLKGSRLGQRSVRLNRAYRAFYVLTSSGEIEVVTVEEVNKHKY